MRIRSLTLAALAVATAVAVPAAGKDKNPSDGTPDESGCRDVVSGSAQYQHLIASFTQEEVAPPAGATLDLYRKAVITVLPKGVATATFRLAEPSCPGVEYTLEAFDWETDQPLARLTQSGDGISGTQQNPFVLEVVVPGYAKQTVGMRVTTTSDGIAHDVAPNAELKTARANAQPNGLPPSDGGAVTSFR